MRSFIIYTILLLTAAIGPFLFPRFAVAANVTITVPTDYATIQRAIDEAYLLWSHPTNTLTYEVLVEPGSYAGGIVLKSNIPVRGRETARTIITGGGSGTLITASGVTSVSVRNFTFRSAQVGIAVTANASVRIENNVFSVGTAGTAVSIIGTTSSSVVNNTFHLSGVAVRRDSDAIVINNNVFYSDGVTTNIGQNFTSENNISYNLFYPDRSPTFEYRGTNFIPNILYPNPDPLFVNTGALDLHVKSSSPCIGTGDTGLPGVQDRGAYGGPAADTIPYPVSGLQSSATGTTPFAISLSWSANAAYNVAGYRVHYGTASGAYTGTDAAEGASPINAGNTTSAVLSALSPTSTPPAAPVLAVPEPRNQGLALSWSAVPGATSYQVHWGTLSTSENAVDVGNRTSYTLNGLTNLQTYLVAVSAVSQATYYIAVTAYDTSGQTLVPGVAHESVYSAEQAVRIGPAQQSGLSNEVSGIPEAIIAYPDLPNAGCFIATAAYSSYDARPVRVLRAFRDRWLETNRLGRTFVRWYYRVSPDLARSLNDHPRWKPAVRAALGPVVLVAAVLVHAPWAAILAPLAVWPLIRNRRIWRRTA